MLEITSLSQFKSLSNKPLLILDFYAIWCGPCKQISPAFEKISITHSSNQNIIFAKCDVDRNQDVSQLCGITAMPTFQFYKDGKKVDEIRGADVRTLTQKIAYFTANVSATPTGPTVRSNGSLRDFFKTEDIVTLGTDRAVFASMLKADAIGSTSLDSHDGPQMLLHFQFKQPLNLTTLKIAPPINKLQHAPARIYMGSGFHAMDASPSTDMQEMFKKADGVQVFSLYSDEYTNGIAELKLKASRFKACKDVTILVEKALAGDDTMSRIAWIDLVGTKA